MPRVKKKGKAKPAVKLGAESAKRRQVVERIASLDELHEDPVNPHTHPDASRAAIRGSVTEFDQLAPLLVQKSSGRVIDGNGRLSEMREMGWTEARIWEVDASDAEAAAMGLALNSTPEFAGWDREALEANLRIVQTANEELAATWAKLAEEQGIIPADAKATGGAGANGDDADELDAGDEPEDALDLLFKAPFPWFGGKSRIARMAWRHFGDVQNVIEPFFGSGAVLLNRPPPFSGTETINDADGLVCNFWRAVKSDPDKVAEYADWPVNENDLHARHAWLVAQKDTLQAKLEGDPDLFDAKVAGWWVWGMACWIGSGFCSGEGPWQIVEGEDGSRQLVHLSDAGRGVNRQLVHLSDAGQGVNRKRVHLSDAGQGVNRKLVHLGDAGQEGEPNAGLGERGLLEWMRALSTRLERVRVCCGDWTRVCGGNTGDALKHFFASGQTCAVFLDPPYADTADRTNDLYRKDSESVAHAVREWAIDHGDDQRLRICLAGYEGEHKMPKSWKCVAWKANGGMSSVGKGETKSKENAHKERCWFSPNCIATESP